MLRIYTPKEKACRKRMGLLLLLFVLVIPASIIIIVDGGTGVISYYANSYSSEAGLVACRALAEVSSILKNIAFACAACILGFEIFLFGFRASTGHYLICVAAPLATPVLAFSLIRTLIALGVHDMTPEMFGRELPKYLFSWLFEYAVMQIIILCSCLLFSLYTRRKAPGEGEDAEIGKGTPFSRSLLLVCAMISAASLASSASDAVYAFTDGGVAFGINAAVSYIIIPLLTEALALAAIIFCVRAVIAGLARDFGTQRKKQ